MNFKKRLIISDYISKLVTREIIDDIINIYECNIQNNENFIVGYISNKNDKVFIKYNEIISKEYLISRNEFSLDKYKKIMLIDNMVHYTILIF